MGGAPQRLIAGLAVGFVALSAALVPSEAGAFERTFHAGLDAGLTEVFFTDYSVAGLSGGTHLMYGISDAFNLRTNLDVSVFDLPDPATSLLVYNATFGAEYLLDTISWVVYGGALAGPVVGSVQNGEDSVQLSLELLGGISYLLSDSWALRIFESRLRLLPFAGEQIPTQSLLFTSGLEYTWNH